VSSNPIFCFFDSPKSFAPTILRLLIAGIFFFHGSQKLFGWFGGPGWQRTIEVWTASTGPDLPYVIAVAAILAEALIALTMFFGFLTRLGGLAIVLVMAGAIQITRLQVGFAGFPDIELPLSLLCVGLALFLIGGGRLSIDRWISKQLLPIIG